MDLERLSAWLRCPVCGEDLEVAPPLVLRDSRGHAFDVNRRGFVTLLSPGTRVVGDSAAMLAARERFLSAGHYDPIVEEIASALHVSSRRSEPEVDVPPDGASGLRILDAGCGTGHYLHALLDRLDGAAGLAADLSPQAVARAVRGREDVEGVVADTWADLPLRDRSADVVLDVFAPRNLPEFHRVLAPAGRVVVVAAASEHLRELRFDGRALGVEPHKRERILDAAGDLFEHEEERRVHRILQLSEGDIGLLLGMGPSAHHPRHDRGASGDDDPARTATADAPAVLTAVTVDVMIHVLRRRNMPGGASTVVLPRIST